MKCGSVFLNACNIESLYITFSFSVFSSSLMIIFFLYVTYFIFYMITLTILFCIFFSVLCIVFLFICHLYIVLLCLFFSSYAYFFYSKHKNKTPDFIQCLLHTYLYIDLCYFSTFFLPIQHPSATLTCKVLP